MYPLKDKISLFITLFDTILVVLAILFFALSIYLYGDAPLIVGVCYIFLALLVHNYVS
jgi:hypothetical protein